MGTYTTVAEVAALLGQTVGRFNEDSLPAKEIVERVIAMMEDYVDKYCQTAWRERKRWEDPDMAEVSGGYEYHRLQRRSWFGFSMMGIPIFLKRRKVLPFDPAKGDSLQVFNGSEWEEWLGTKVEGIEGDFWVAYDSGVLRIRRVWAFGRFEGPIVRVRYRYGWGPVPGDIRYATTLLVACHLIESGDYTILLPEGANNIVNAINKVNIWWEKAHEILERHREVLVVDTA
jgi:hypothetical protein